jgi:hypothetical protein
MRTTVNLPDDVYHAARSLADTKDISLGDALALLVRRQFNLERGAIRTRNEFPTFAVSRNAQPITLEHTLEMEDEL